MNFAHFQLLISNAFEQGAKGGALPAKYQGAAARHLHPLVLAYVGDAYFSLFVRTRLLAYEQNKVRVLHTFDSKMVSAVMQAFAYRQIEEVLSEEERAVVRRGRNAKSTVPKSASVAEYRCSTGFEALLGYLYLSENFERLSELAERSFAVIFLEMTKTDKKR